MDLDAENEKSLRVDLANAAKSRQVDLELQLKSRLVD